MKRLVYLSITCFVALCLNFCINERRGRAAATPVSVTGTTPYLATDDAEAFEGDSDDNTVSYEDSEEGVTVDLETPENNVGDFAEGDTFDNIESLIGSDFDDTLTGDSGDNTLRGGAGADILDGGAGADTASYAGSEDPVTVDLSQSPVSATDGDAAGDTLSNIENLIGSAGDDTLTGDSGDNTLAGGAGADTLDGGAGADTASYEGSSLPVTIDLSQSPVSATGSDAQGDVLSNIENLIGSTGDDILTGDSGDNTLTGGAGADMLRGGAGADTLVGGAGADTYVFLENDGTDTITDTSGAMTLQFSGNNYAFLVAGNFARSSNDLVITITVTASGVTNMQMITIIGAYMTTGQTDNTAFSILMEVNGRGVTDVWSALNPP